MPILHEFEYFKPKNMAEALRLLAKFKKPAILAGGTDIIGNIKEEVDKPDALIDIKGLTALRKIRLEDGGLQIGSLVTFSEIIKSAIINKRFPVMVEVAKTVGSVGIRNRATMVGNICSAVPCIDSGPLLIAYDAMVTTRGVKGERKIPITNWFCGPRKTALKKGEIATGISIPIPKHNHSGCFVKLGRYSGEDLAQASVLVLAFADKTYRVAFGSVAPVPIRGEIIEDMFEGEMLDDNLIDQATALVSEIISPITDIRATKEYRMHMCKVMLERAIIAARGRLAGKGPEYGTSVM